MSRKKALPNSDKRLPKLRPGAAGGKRDENRRAKQQLLLNVATDLFKNHGLEAVTIDEIVERAGISKGSFYSYFDSKSELVKVLFTPLTLQLEEAFQEAKASMRQAEGELELFKAYQDMAKTMAQSCLAVPDLVLIYLAESRGVMTEAREPVIQLSQLVMHHALELTAIAQDRQLLRPFDAKVSSLAVIGAIERLLLEYLRGTLEGHPVELTVALISLVLDGLQKDQSPQ